MRFKMIDRLTSRTVEGVAVWIRGFRRSKADVRSTERWPRPLDNRRPDRSRWGPASGFRMRIVFRSIFSLDTLKRPCYEFVASRNLLQPSMALVIGHHQKAWFAA